MKYFFTMKFEIYLERKFYRLFYQIFQLSNYQILLKTKSEFKIQK